MHQELAVKIDARHSPETFLPVYREKQGVNLHQSVISHLEANFDRSCQQVLLHSLFTLQNLEDSVSLGDRNITIPGYSAEWSLSGSDYKRLCWTNTRVFVGPAKDPILVPV
jgi:hypothetical protein